MPGGAPMDGWESLALIVAVILWLMAGMMMWLRAAMIASIPSNLGVEVWRFKA